MTLDEMIAKLMQARDLVGGSTKVIVDSENYVIACHRITDIVDDTNNRNAVVINVSR